MTQSEKSTCCISLQAGHVVRPNQAGGNRVKRKSLNELKDEFRKKDSFYDGFSEVSRPLTNVSEEYGILGRALESDSE